MTFNMKGRPMIKGTQEHKDSIAKATSGSQPLVAQTRTSADKSLVESAQLLGSSYSPKDIDYSLDTKISLKDLKYKSPDEDPDNTDKELTGWEWKHGEKPPVHSYKSKVIETDPNQRRGSDDNVIDPPGSSDTQINPSEDDTEKSNASKESFSGKIITEAPKEYIDRMVNSIEFSDGSGVIDNLSQERIDKMRNHFQYNMTNQERADFLSDMERQSPARKIERKMFKNAVPGGPLRKAMIKNGYNPEL